MSNKVFLPILAALMTFSCVDDVDFYEAYEKEIVVMCTLNNLGDVQHLYMHYNKSVESDAYEPLKGEVKAVLYSDNDRSNGVKFERISDLEWTANYHIAPEIEDETWEVPFGMFGTDTITVRHVNVQKKELNLEVSIDGKTVAHSHATVAPAIIISSVEFAFNEVFSSENYVFWFVNYDGGVFSEKVTLTDTYHFPYEEAKKIRSDGIKNLDGFSLIGTNEYYFGARFEGDSGGSIPENQLFIPSVEYDEYLKSLIYRAIHIDPDDPAKQMNDYKVKSNIIGGTGVFGVYYLISSPPENTYISYNSSLFL